MSISTDKGPQIRISFDSMEAFMSLPIPADGVEYTIDDVVRALEIKGVKAGVDKELIEKMVADKKYSQERRIAVGVPCEEGTDGYYEFKFNREFSKAPKILPDGTADYYSMNTMAIVQEGEVIAIYHHAIPGKNGINVKGVPQNCKRVKELAPLVGKGVVRGADEDTYTAEYSGKITCDSNNKITISPVLEISSDIGVQTGNIDFTGDVVIHGMVKTGMMIRSTGGVVIDGVVENASITAGRDIVLKSGLMGNSEAVIRTKGNLYAKFVEYATLDITGTINAEVLFNCDTVCGEKVIISGSKGYIVGGFTRAIGGVEANAIGNDIEAKTIVAVGAEAEVYRRMKFIENRVQTAKKNITAIETQIKEIEMKEANRSVVERPKSDPRKVSLLRMKVKESTTISKDNEEMEELKEIVERAKGASVTAYGNVYPGVIIKIDEITHPVNDMQEQVVFVKAGDKIHMERAPEVF